MILDKLISRLADGAKPVTIKAASAAEVKKIRKAVWKEKDQDRTLDQTPCTCSSCKGKGAPIKEKYRLTCDIEDTLMTFRLVLNQTSIHNL